jgi:hypothetical protein
MAASYFDRQIVVYWELRALPLQIRVMSGDPLGTGHHPAMASMGREATPVQEEFPDISLMLET